MTRDRFEQTDRRTANIQTHWEAYKNSIHKLAKEAAKECYHKITSCITVLEKDLRETNNKPDVSMNKETQAHKAILSSQLKHLKKKDMKNKKDLMKVKLANHGECLGGMWSALSKEKRPRSLIHRLKIPNTNPPQYEHSSKRMAELACCYDPVLPPFYFSFTLLLFQSRDLEHHLTFSRDLCHMVDHLTSHLTFLSHDHLIVLTAYCSRFPLFPPYCS